MKLEELHQYEKEMIAEVVRDYDRLSDDAKDVFHDVILQWNIHPGWVVLAVFLIGILVSKVFL